MNRAVMRIKHELERMPPHQFIWFLAPNVTLCEQQAEYISSQVPSQIKLLTGADGVDRWTQQSLWDDVLTGVKVLVTTYQILLDALTHGFVRMESLSMMVFDEAHNCVGKHPGAKIMLSFYHKEKEKGHYVPYILGLTASPVMRSDPTSLEKIEITLDSRCRTPTHARSELLLHVKLPTLSEVFYQTSNTAELLGGYTTTVSTLGKAFANLNIFEDPYVLDLRRQDTEKSRRSLEKVLLNHKTWCFGQMKAFHAFALKVCQELGNWAADYYVSTVVTKFLKIAGEVEDSFGGMWDVTTAEKQYLANALQKVEINPAASKLPDPPLVSDKVQQLINILIRESNSFRGIIFVQERVMVSVLAYLLSIHPSTCDRFKIGMMTGTSSHSYRGRNISEFVSLDSQVDTLVEFRAGRINLVIATSVLEEGIDVPACNVVICFQKPANLKSFVQRRGRARQRDSKLILLLEETPDNKTTDWHKLEMEMRKMYEDDMRILQELMKIEESEEHDNRFFKVEKTGAILDLDNALPHLHHFCATLPAKEYVDLRPEFLCTKAAGDHLRSRVILPLSVNEQVREAESLQLWKSEKNANKDAAFQAYVGLYRGGLVNDNLLPILRHSTDVDDLKSTKVETRASIMLVSEQMSPWINIAKAWGVSQLTQATITVGTLSLQVFLPTELPFIPPFPLYWDQETELVVEVSLGQCSVQSHLVTNANDDTHIILQAAFGHRFSVASDGFVMLFGSTTGLLQQDNNGTSIMQSWQEHGNVNLIGLVRDNLDPNIRYIFRDLLSTKPPIQQVQQPYEKYQDAPDIPHVVVKRLPRRSNFLHQVIASDSPPSQKPYSVTLPFSRCIIDRLPFSYVQLGLFIPSIMHRFSVYLLASILSSTILKEVQILDISIVVTAISASSAREEGNYQRLEFLGDSILKLCASIQLIAEYPLWHEGLLSAKKDRLVANSRLSRAAVETGLDRFIITKQFTAQKWRPLYIKDLLQTRTDLKRKLSSKVLADVVEALVGAAMVNGGLPKALKCLQTFLPELQWLPLLNRQSILYLRAPDVEMPETLKPLQSLLGYQFKKPSLLIEALTHASSNSGSQSLERFEFLGDSILDNIIVTAMFAHQPELSHFQMHLLRTALVNADFLGFICMEFSLSSTTSTIVEVKSKDGNGGLGSRFEAQTEEVKTPLYKFLRHSSPQLTQLQRLTSLQHQALRPAILNIIESGTYYPWALLSRLQLHKFYSDIIESLLGALWIDSGSLFVCTEFVKKLGILPYCSRILNENVGVWHPKEELGVLADSEEVKYRVSILKAGEVVEDEDRKEGGVKGRYVCEVFVGDEMVVRYAGGVDKDEVRTSAAEKAVEILRGRTKRTSSREERKRKDMSGVRDVKASVVMDGDDVVMSHE
ncbi:dicer-like protein-like protein 2 [Tricladium varicosporioides]|nr:dicer-like protein-like protein 2 [Hymenoscyphus varicosporioides]